MGEIRKSDLPPEGHPPPAPATLRRRRHAAPPKSPPPSRPRRLPAPLPYPPQRLPPPRLQLTRPFSLEDYLVASCGLAPAQARSASKKALAEASRVSAKALDDFTCARHRTRFDPESPTPSSPCYPAPASPAPTSPTSSPPTRCSSAHGWTGSGPASATSATALGSPFPRSPASSRPAAPG